MALKNGRSGKNLVWPSELDDLLWRTGTPTKRAASWLNRTPRTVHDWRTGRRPVPRWAFELVKFRAWEGFEAWGLDLHFWRYRQRINLRLFWPNEARNDPKLEMGTEPERTAMPSNESAQADGRVPPGSCEIAAPDCRLSLIRSLS